MKSLTIGFDYEENAPVVYNPAIGALVFCSDTLDSMPDVLAIFEKRLRRMGYSPVFVQSEQQIADVAIHSHVSQPLLIRDVGRVENGSGFAKLLLNHLAAKSHIVVTSTFKSGFANGRFTNNMSVVIYVSDALQCVTAVRYLCSSGIEQPAPGFYAYSATAKKIVHFYIK